jgi:hypothetical protein
MASSVIQNPNEISKLVTSEFIVSDIASASRIYARKSGNILIVTGYINPNSAISANTNIAKISQTVIQEAMVSPNGSDGSASRMVLRQNGNIAIERPMNANTWYSFTIVAPIR